jgi:hypothetical protein
MSDNSLLIQPDHGELFSGPRVVTVTEYAAIRLSAGRHEIVITAERPVLVTIVPASEAGEL